MMSLKRILVATDFSPASEAALRYGRALARQLGATLEVLHIWDDATTGFAGLESYTVELASLRTQAEAAARDKLATLLSEQDRASIGATTRLLASHHPATTIVEHAARENVDLIVVGSHGRQGVERWLLGSVAERIVRMARCPVLTVKHPEHDFVTPDALEAVKSASM